jgi:hypothetical protein
MQVTGRDYDVDRVYVGIDGSVYVYPNTPRGAADLSIQVGASYELNGFLLSR